MPGTWPPKKPVRSNLKDVSVSGCKEKVATPNATCLTDLGVSRLPPEPSEAITHILLAHSQVTNRAARDHEQTKLDLCPKIPGPMSKDGLNLSRVCD